MRSHNKRRRSKRHVEHESTNSSMEEGASSTETNNNLLSDMKNKSLNNLHVPNTLLESENSSHANSNDASSLQSESLKDHEQTKGSTIKTSECILPQPPFDTKVPCNVSRAYYRFRSTIKRCGGFNGLNFVSVIRIRLINNDNPYILHRRVNSANKHEGIQGGFSYSAVELCNFTKTNEQVKTLQDKWLTLFVRGSEMTEKEVDEIFGNDPMFQGIFQTLKLANWTEFDRQKYAASQEARFLYASPQRLSLSIDKLMALEKAQQNQVGLETGRKKLHDECFEIGRQLGFEVGFEIGYKRGFEIGFERRMKIGVDDEIRAMVMPKLQIIIDEEARKLHEKKQRIATKLLSKGYSIPDIIYFSELTKEEIEQLQDNNKKADNQECMSYTHDDALKLQIETTPESQLKPEDGLTEEFLQVTSPPSSSNDEPCSPEEPTSMKEHSRELT
jgi:hypothetical protein